MRYPEFLKPGGNIGFIAPSFGCTFSPYVEMLDQAQSTFKEMGYTITEGPNARLALGVGKSNSPKACGHEVNDFFINNRCDAIISCGGGELMCEDIPYFDFKGISNAKAKWYIGYSDNTNLTFLLPTICDTAAIYGSCANEFGMVPWPQSVEDAYMLMTGAKTSFSNYDGWELDKARTGEHPTEPFIITEPYRQIVAGNKVKATHFSGRMLGGCIDCLATLCGTRFDKVKAFNEKYAKDGVIWFLEACDLGAMGMRRALWQLEQAGWFESVKGFIIGRPLHYEDDFGGFTHHDAVTGILEKYNVPIIMDVDLGHLPPKMPFISGGYADVVTTANTINISYKMI